MPNEIKIFIGIWAILSLALVLTACVTDDEQEETQRDCVYYQASDSTKTDTIDFEILMAKTVESRLCTNDSI